MSTDCSHENIVSSPDVCSFIAQHCQERFSYFNFLNFYYCDLDQSLPLIILISLIFAFLVFNILGAISDTYLAPALETVSKKLKLSETIAGITLLAFAASAPDVVTGLVAGGKEEGGSRIIVGGLFGACLFTVTVVLAGCVKGAGEVHADKRALARDIGFLLLSVLYFMVLTLFEEITPLLAAGFFVIYVIFFVYVILTEKRKSKKAKKAAQRQVQIQETVIVEDAREIEIEDPSRSSVGSEEKDVVDQDMLINKRVIPGLLTMRQVKTHNVIAMPTKLIDESDEEEDEMGVSQLNINYRKGWRRMNTELPPGMRFARQKTLKPINNNVKKRNFRRAETDNVTHLLKETHEEESETSSEQEEEKIGTFHRVLKWVNIPILFVGDLTMLPVESERWNNWTAALTAILGPLFLIWELGFISFMDSKWWYWAVFGAVSVSLAAVIFIQGQNRNLAEHYSTLFSSLTLVIAVFWLNLVSSLIVDFLMFIQIVTGLSLYFLSITILAWGNSLEDYFVNYAIAKNGHGKTALGGVYGSQIFALLIGFGGGLFRLALNKPIKLGLYDFTGGNTRENIMTLVLLGSMILVLGMTLVVGRMTKWVIGKKVVMSVLAFYAVFTVGITLVSFA